MKLILAVLLLSVVACDKKDGSDSPTATAPSASVHAAPVTVANVPVAEDYEVDAEKQYAETTPDQLESAVSALESELP